MTEELKPLPCPFDGGMSEVETRVYDGYPPDDLYRVKCWACGAKTALYSVETEAIKAWNTRSPAWRDIESAPRDGFESPVLVWNGFWRGVAWYDDDMREGERWVAEDGAIVGLQPTHWMPLPLPPEER